jgi:hypothetical protein
LPRASKPVLNKLAREVATDILSSDKDKISIEEYCKEKLEITYKGLSKWQVAEMLSSLVEKTKYHLQKIEEDKHSRGIEPEFELVEFPPDTLLRRDLLRGEDGLSYVRKYRKEILDAIRKMHWRNFEFLCEHLLNINNIVISGVAGGTRDSGIDIYGMIEMNRFSQRVLLRDAKIKIIGQAKRYKSVVDHTEVRVFKTHRDELLQNTGNAIRKLPSWFIESRDPLLSIFIVTTKFTRGAKTYANKNDIILKDGEQVVEDLIRSGHVREWFSRKNGILIFDESLFTEFFKKKKDAYQTLSHDS